MKKTTIARSLVTGLFATVLVCTAQAQFEFTTQIGGGALGSITTNAEPGSYTVIGGGNDIWSSADEFTFHYFPVVGDFDVRVRIESIELMARWSKAGLMVRETVNGDSRMAFSKATGYGTIVGNDSCGNTDGAADVSFMYRTWRAGEAGNGGEHEDRLVADPGYPAYKWVRLQRQGNLMKGYASADGVTWQPPVVQDTATWLSPIGGSGTPTPFAQNALLGVAVSRHGCGTKPTCQVEMRELGIQPVAIVSQPASITNLVGRATSFTLGLSGSYTYVQWKRDGVDIPGANSTTYTIPSITAADNGATFSAVASNLFTSNLVVSDTATLTVIEDVDPPAVVEVLCDSSFSKITLVYNEVVDPNSATDQLNTTFDGNSPLANGTMLPDGRSVQFTVNTYAPETDIVIDIQGVQDAFGNALTTNFTWRSCGFIRGFLLMRTYEGISGTAVSGMTSSPNYPNNPSRTTYIKSFNSREFLPTDGLENYGARIEGFFIPPVSGDYRFQLLTDDASELWFNRLGADATAMVKIAEDTGCCGPWDKTGAVSAAQTGLVAGQPYAIMLLYKEGGGGDYGLVAARLTSQPVITGSAQDASLVIPSCQLAVLAGPNIGAKLIGVTGPVDYTTTANVPGVFSVTPQFQGSTTITPNYMWEKSTDNGATWQSLGCGGATYTTAAPTLADDGTLYRCVAMFPGTPGDKITSAAARLTVLPNPALVSASSKGNPHAIYVTFSQPMQLDGTYTVLASNTVPAPGGTVFYSEDFNAGDGGFTVDTPQAYDGPWVYSAGTGSWTEAGQEAENGHPNTSILISPSITVTQAGVVQLSFAHRWSFEVGNWDGGQVRVSINGGPWTTIPQGSFTQNGYNGTVANNPNCALSQQIAFVETSPNFTNGPITSVCTLGAVNAGDTIRVQFFAANDTNTRGPNQPNWEVDSLQLSVTSAPVTPLAVTVAGYGASQSEVKLDVAPDLVQRTYVYYVTVAGAHSQGDNLPIYPDPATVTMRHGVGYPIVAPAAGTPSRLAAGQFVGGTIRWRQWNGLNQASGGIPTFMTNPRYVTGNPPPDRDTTVPAFETPGSENGGNYGAEINGTWIVPATGTYKFWVSADDNAIVYIATDGNPANKVTLCREPEWANYREWYPGRGGTDTANRGNPPVNVSAEYDLTAGQQVYLQGDWIEGGGGDHLSLTYSYTRTAPNGCPFTIVGDVFVSQQPQNQTVYTGLPATFSVAADGTPGFGSQCYYYQWYKNSNVIAGATSSTLVYVPDVTDNGAVFQCAVANDFSTNMSAGAVLTVLPDLLAVSAVTRGDPNHIYVTFNKPVQRVGTYSLSGGLNVTGTAQGASPNEVVLTTDTIPYDVTTTLTILDEMDLGSVMQAVNPTNFVVMQGVSLADFNGPLPVNARIYGNAAVNPDGSLHLTEAVNSQQGSLVVNLGKQVTAFKAAYRLLMGDPTAGLADGSSFSFGNDVADGNFGEGGSGTGLIVRFNTYAGWFRGALLYWRGQELTRLPFEPVATPARFVPVSIQLTANGQVTVSYDGTNLFTNFQLPNWAPIQGVAKIGIGARTGGENQKNYIDDLWFSDSDQAPVGVAITPTDPTVFECASGLTLTAFASGAPLYRYQWLKNGVAIPGATGPTYTPPAIMAADEGTVYSVQVANAFSTASASTTIHVNTNAPTATVGSLQGCAIGVRFDQEVELNSAVNPLNYSINGAAPGEGIVPPIIVQPDNRTVIISNTPCLTGQFTLAISNVADRCTGTKAVAQVVTGNVQNYQITSIGTETDPFPRGVGYGLADNLLQVTTGGSDWWGTEDHAVFVYEQRCGDFDMQVEVARLDYQSHWSKAGLAARISLAGNSPMVSTYENPINGANQVEAGLRATLGGDITDWQSVPRPVASTTKAIRLVRIQDRFIALNTQDGTNWTIHADTGTSFCGSVPANLFVGVFATPNNGNNGYTTTAEFKDFILSPQGSCVPEPCGAIAIARDTNVVGNVVITWNAGPCCILQGATDLTGPWTDIGGASPVSVPATDPYRFYRLIRRVLP